MSWRCGLWFWLLAGAMGWMLGALPALAATPVRVGLTAVILTDRQPTLDAWGSYLQDQLGRPVVFVQRRTYHEIVQLLLAGKLDFAWVCGYPYVASPNHALMRRVVVPLYRGQLRYQSYLIVPADDRRTQTFSRTWCAPSPRAWLKAERSTAMFGRRWLGSIQR